MLLPFPWDLHCELKHKVAVWQDYALNAVVVVIIRLFHLPPGAFSTADLLAIRSEIQGGQRGTERRDPWPHFIRADRPLIRGPRTRSAGQMLSSGQ